MTNIINLTNTNSLIKVSGEKAETFLQGQLTCDVREISDTQTRLSAYCNPKGRVLSSFRVLKLQDTLHFLAPTDMADAIIKQLTPYARFSRVEFSIETSCSITGLWGVGKEIDKIVTQNDCSLIRLSGKTPRYILLGKAADELNKSQPELTTNITDAWDYLDIQNKIATIHPETSNSFTPQMLGYLELNAVSLKKGCYIGQEVIARTHYLGKAKRHLYQGTVASEESPKPGDLILDGDENEAGVLINIAFNQTTNQYDFLAVIKDECIHNPLTSDQHTILISQ